ncbi:MAG: restriction endonuclease, partial [Bacteroidetes bacterium]
NDVFENNASDYGRKLYLIENCIYGIDIQPIAVQIAKLRFFISLIVDQKINSHKENFGIRSLPNLETKFVAANTLIGLEKSQQLSFRNPEIEKKENELKQLRHEYFTANTRKRKLELQKKDKILRKEIAELLEKDGWPETTARQIAAFDPYDQNHFANWFDPEWMFGITSGFDIVIGNPPYIQLQKNSGQLAKLYEKQNFQTFARTGDIYALFYEKGMQLLKDNGILAYITSNKWMRAGYGEKLRVFFTLFNPIILIDLGPDVFENATVDTNILFLQKNKPQTTFQLKAITLQKNDRNNIARALLEQYTTLEKLSADAWFIGSSAEQQLKEKIERIGKPLKDWDVKIYRGVLTGLNEAFIITTEKRNEILANCSVAEASRFGGLTERERTEAIIKPILRGRDIKRYYYEWAGLWVIFIPWHFPLHEDTSIQGASEKAEKEFQKQYPAIYSHLLEFKEPLSKRNKEETGIRYEWYALQRCAATYYPEFEKEKVVYGQFQDYAEYSFCEAGIYLSSNEYM